ncbi:sulfatase-like hydrolase/transferase [Rhodococcus sp. ACPA1]|uniref:sulfatase-like hydrolase/transferase n=1 Tax=Rhodococcus sp. ACPA1 TaxID=2028572 RepID=UPI000BB14DD8|nr:sulfatase-like hydrolase/transferase [Rhodococcus sp. ACPA1]PBC47447.1 sulfatase [Rhodococcus sp. ACPA1]
MTPNVLIVMSDQHVPAVCGAYGNRLVRTPNLDRLASRGTTFDAGYCNSPICVPSRAAMATGRYVHQTGNHDNASPYTGAEAPSWGHRAQSAGITATTIGKLHYRAVGDDTGFRDQRVPLHVRGGTGDLFHALRDRQPPALQLREAVLDVRADESDYSRFDHTVAEEAVHWLHTAATRDDPWLCKVSFVTPHYPFTVPQEFLDLYSPESVPTPVRSHPAEWERHPAVDIYRNLCGLDTPLTDEQTRTAVQAYYGLVSFMDAQVGIVLDALEESGQLDNTLVLYVSDHGELLGTDGLWFKGTMGEMSVRIPVILAGPGVSAGTRCATPVSLVDVYPTVVDALNLPAADSDATLPGRSLIATATDATATDRVVFSEFHSANSHTGLFMIRRGQWKYIYCVGFAEQLFDLAADPREFVDLATDPQHASVLARCREALYEICDPVAVDETIRQSQRRRVEDYGGLDKVLEKPLMAYSPTSGS